MRKTLFPETLIALMLLLLLFSGCTKEYRRLSKQEIREEFISGFTNDINADSLRQNVDWLQKMSTRFMLADNHRQIAVNIKNKFVQIGYPETTLDSFFVTTTYNGTSYNSWQYNVIASVKGISDSDSLCIIGAHYDNKLSGPGNPFLFVPGACDNASGVAATLEIARIFTRRSFNPKYTIQFVAFAAEELGLYGGYNFAQRAGSREGKIMMMLNNDMIAWPSNSPASAWTVNIIDYDNSHDLRLHAENLCRTHTKIKYINDNELSGRSDSYPFFLNGYKSLFFIQTNLGSNYHTINDLVSILNFDYCREIVKISCALLVDKNYPD